MRQSSMRCPLALALPLIALMPFISWAASIPVTNFGFESPAYPSDGQFGPVNNWSAYNPNSLSITNGGHYGAWNAPATSYSPVETTEGVNAGWVFNDFTGPTDVIGMQQTLSSLLTADTLYTLKVDVGNPSEWAGAPGYHIQLLAGANVLAADNNSLTVADGSWATSTISYTALSGNPFLGQNLTIRLIVDPDIAETHSWEMDFDNVRLDATAVPEPSSLAMAALGILCLAATSWRQNR